MTIISKVSSIALAFTAAIGLSSTSHAETTFTLSSWLPPSHPIVADMIKPWADAVEAETGGNVKIRILPKPLGAPPAHFDLAKDGVADITYGVHGYQPGRFVLTKAIELPFLGNTAEAMSVAYWRIYEKHLAAADEHKGTKLLGVMSHGPGSIFNAERQINSLADLKGLKIRVGGGVVNVKHATIVPGGMYNTSFFLVMNPRKFDALSAEDQASILSVSGENFARLAGKAWDVADKAGREAMKADGVNIIDASPELVSEIESAVSQIEADWISEVDAKGLDGAQIMQDLRAEIASME